MRIDRSEDDGEHPDTAAPPTGRRADTDDGVREARAASVPGSAGKRDDADRDGDASSARVERNLAYRATVEAVNRGYAIDQGYAKVREIEEKTVTPAMRRIEAEDPERHLVGLENRLKGKDRLTEKVGEAVDERGHTVDEALSLVKDAIRYTFCYPDDRYTDGLVADCERLEDAGFTLYDRRNSWRQLEYKGVNSRWQVPGSGQVFEVQFHTQASLDAKEETHWAYEKLRTLPENDEEVRELHAYQREVTSKVPVPHGAPEIPDHS